MGMCVPRKVLLMGLAIGCFQAGLTASIAAPGAAPSTQVYGITLGIQHPPTINYGDELDAVNGLANKKHGMALYYVNWATPFSGFLLDQIQSQMLPSDRPVVMIDWGPAGGKQSLGCDQDYSGAVSFDAIIRGLCDDYIRDYALAIKARPERILVKFAHEMNGGGQPWSPINIGVQPSKYVQMWRHVHDVFVSMGVTNVDWVWAPIYLSYPTTPENDIHLYYPGDDYVDWVAVSGYNYFDQMPGAPQPWYTFEDIYDAVLSDFACRYPKPQMIHEFGSVEAYDSMHSKAQWIGDAYLKAQNYPFLRAIVWYNDRDFTNPSADFRITSSTYGSGSVQALPAGSGAWTNAYRNAVASAVYTKTLPSVTVATPPGVYCGNGEAVFTVQPSIVFVTPGESSRHTLTGLVYSSAVNPSLTLPPGISGSVNPGTLPVPWGKATIHLTTTLGTSLGTYTVTVQAGTTSLPIQVRVLSTVKRVYLPTILK